MGHSGKSRLSQVERIDLQALVDCAPRLSADLRAATQPALNRLKNVLSRENDSNAWYLELQKARDGFENDVSKFKSEKNNRDFENEIYKAKYDAHPNVLRVKRAYVGAVADVEAAIQAETLPAATKTKLLAKLHSIQLNTRYDSEVETPINCFHNLINAFYEKGYVTVCNGYFNAFQSEDALRQTLAHELGHGLSMMEHLKVQDDMEQFLDQTVPLLSNQGIPCTEWDQQLNDIAKAARRDSEVLWPPELSRCLNQSSEVEHIPYKGADVIEVGMEPSQNFSFLTKKATLLCDKNKHPEWFGNVQQFIEDNKNSLTKEHFQISLPAENALYFPEAFIFQQIMKCHPSMSCEQGIKNARQVVQQVKSFKGRAYDPKLFFSEEYFADWMAAKALKSRFARARGNAEQNLQQMFLAGSLYCKVPDIRVDKYDAELDQIDNLRQAQQLTGKGGDNHPFVASRLEQLLESESLNRYFNCRKSPSRANAKPNYFDCPKSARK